MSVRYMRAQGFVVAPAGLRAALPRLNSLFARGGLRDVELRARRVAAELLGGRWSGEHRTQLWVPARVAAAFNWAEQCAGAPGEHEWSERLETSEALRRLAPRAAVMALHEPELLVTLEAAQALGGRRAVVEYLRREVRHDELGGVAGSAARG